MSIERDIADANKERNPSPFIFFLTGGGTKYSGMGTMQQELGENGSIYNSILFGGTKPDKDRYIAICPRVKEQLEKGRKVCFFSHSLGAAETVFLVEALKGTLGNDWLVNYKEQIQFVFDSPAAPKNRWEAAKYLGKFISQVMIQEAATVPLSLTFPLRTRSLRYIASLATIPPEDFNENATLYTLGMRNTTHRLSQATEIIPELLFKPDQNYMPLFNAKKQENIKKLDKSLIDEFKGQGDKKRVQRLLRRRAKITRSRINKIYAGKYTEQRDATVLHPPKVKKTKEGRQLRNHVLLATFWRPQISTHLSEIADVGIQTTLIIPEFDVLFTRKEALELAKGRQNVQIRVATMATHAYPLGAQPTILSHFLHASEKE